MKKKLILIFSLIILSVCIFAFSSSASEFDFVVNSDSILDSFNGGVGSFQNYSVQYNIPSDDYYYEMFYFTFYTSGGSTAYCIQPIGFKRMVDHICGTSGDCTYEQFLEACEIQNENFQSTFYDDWIGSYCGLDNNYFNRLYYYSEIGEADLNEKYNEGLSQGKIDGVNEFKQSEEYKGQYTTGYSDGINNFKETELPEMLLLEREIGQAEGKDIYMASEEYSNVLKAEYDNGFKAATTEQDRKQMQNNLGAILGTCGVIVIALSVVYLVVSRKKHKRR